MTTTTAKLWPASATPPRFERLVLFDDHDAPPSTDRDMRRLVEQAAGWGVTDVVDGVSNVVGDSLYLLGSGDEASRIQRIADYAAAHQEAGLRYHVSLWDKIRWHRALMRLGRKLANVLGGLLASLVLDSEGDRFGRVAAGYNHTLGAEDFRLLRDDIPCPLGLTTTPHHITKARPYLEVVDWLLFQILSFEEPERGMGLNNPLTLPGFWVEEMLDRLAGVWSWLEQTTQVVVLNASYKLDRWRGVDAADAFEIPMRVLLAHGRRSAGVFSRLWMERDTSLGDELVALGPLRQIPEAQRIDEMLGGATPEEAEAELTRAALITLLEETDGRGAVELVGAEADEVYDDTRAAVLAHEGFTWDERPDWINVVCIDTEGGVDAYDDDLLLCGVDDKGVRRVVRTPLNMEPSSSALRRPVPMAVRRGGTAKVYAPQQVKGYVLAAFKGMLSLCQYRTTGKVKVWRDNDRNGELAPVEVMTLDEGWLGIFGHQGGTKHTGSAGCWTWPPSVQALIVRTLRIHAQTHGPRSFTVTFIPRSSLPSTAQDEGR